MIRDIATKINELAQNHKIGRLQDLRKELKPLKQRAGRTIFHNRTINDKEQWAFHYGGRKELQFNIGIEKTDFRYGVALSLEKSPSLYDISILFPVAKRLNQFIREEASFFRKYQMWHYRKGTRSATGAIEEISEDLLKPKTFIFIGKKVQIEMLNYKDVLSTFDDLMTPYLFVLAPGKSVNMDTMDLSDDFTFSRQRQRLPKHRNYSYEAKAVNLDIRHTLIQEELVRRLTQKYGSGKVGWECRCGRKRIDVVLKDGQEHVFYEIKVSGSARACVRDAIGQLMDYAYWPDRQNASRLVVVGEEESDDKTKKYIHHLKKRLNLPIEYQRIEIE